MINEISIINYQIYINNFVCSRASTRGLPGCARMTRGAKTSSAIGKPSKVTKSDPGGEDVHDVVKDDDCQVDNLPQTLPKLLHDDDGDNHDDGGDDDHYDHDRGGDDNLGK